MRRTPLIVTTLLMSIALTQTACNRKPDPVTTANPTDTIEITLPPPPEPPKASSGTAQKPKAKKTESKLSASTKSDPTPSLKSPEKNTLFQLKGTFVKVTEGDPMQFEMLDAAGKRRIFYAGKNLPNDQLEPFYDPGMRGRNVEIEWRRVDHYFPGSGKSAEVNEVVSIAW